MVRDKRKAQLTSEFLKEVVDSFEGRKAVTFGEILHALHERGFGVLMMVFNLPNLLPIPGLTLIGAIPIIFFSFQMVLGFDSPWLPHWLRDKSISHDNLEMVRRKVHPYLTKVEKLIRPRILWLSARPGERFVGMLCLAFAVVFALPIPLANFFPVVAVLVISIGLFNRDGLAIIVGIITGIIGAFVAMIVVAVGVQGFYKLLHLFGWT